jgi:hypothetical protein
MKKQSIKYLWGAIITVVALIGIKVIASSDSPTSQIEPVGNGELTISETNWDFGDIPMSKGVTTKSVSLKNDTDAPVTITSMQTSCMCTSAQIIHSNGSKSGIKSMVGHGGGTATLSETIEAGEVATLLVNYNPNAHGPNATGPITRNVDLETNSQTQPKIKLTFSGNVVK